MASSVATPLERQFSRIAGVTEMTSTSRLGQTNVVLQFDLNRNIDAAARDVQAAINAAAGNLPTNLPTLPFYRKINPADAPILNIAVQSDVLPLGRLYDVADSIVAQRLSRVRGVGQVTLGGSARPAVTVELNPAVLAGYGIGLEDVRTALSQINSNQAKGGFDNGFVHWVLSDNDQLVKASQYRPLIIAYHNGAPVRLSDVATVEDSVENVYTAGLSNGKGAIVMQVFRQPGANIVGTVDRVRAVLPELQASIPASIELRVVQDRTVTIRASVIDIEFTM